MALVLIKTDLQIQSNNEAHHTNEISEDYLIVRRGFHFRATLEFSRAFNNQTDQLLVTAETGERPSEELGTRSTFSMPSNAATSKGKWSMNMDRSTLLHSSVMRVFITASVDAPIGEYRLSLQANGGTAVSMGELVLLYNPWSPEDSVYMPEEVQRQEYVMNEHGIIYRGVQNHINALFWDYGQFEAVVLKACLKLLEVSRDSRRDPAMDASKRWDPIYVSRIISAVINSNDDQGVVVGNWSGRYFRGHSPSHWSGSVEILRKWLDWGRQPVRYGQCWVFAGVMCTVMRCLGIPCRVVTNFQSAHDTDGNLTIDVYHADYGVRERQSKDSIWNYHVWVEAWMKRPDLDADGKYDGWQVCDPTPQERSDGVFCCGPASILSIKEGATNLKYDIPFIFAEVNADCIDWLLMADGSMMKIFSDTIRVGQNISTKSIGTNKREDITDTYKHPEGTEEERASLNRAVNGGMNGTGNGTGNGTEKPDEDPDNGDGTPDVPAFKGLEMTLEEVSQTINGLDINLKLTVKSEDQEPQSLSFQISTQAMRYTGVLTAVIQKEDRKETLYPGKDLCIELSVPFSVYGKYAPDCDSLKVTALAKHCSDNEPSTCQQIFMTERDIVLEDPPMTVTCVGEAHLGQVCNVEIVFRNPIDQTLTNCSMTFTGSGLLPNDLEHRLPILDPGKQFRIQLALVPYRLGSKTLLVDFDCSAFRDIKSSCNINVSL